MKRPYSERNKLCYLSPTPKKVNYLPQINIFDNEENKNVILEYKSCIKFLGLLIDENLSRKGHIHTLRTKISKTVSLIAKLRHIDPNQTFLNIYKSLILLGKITVLKSLVASQFVYILAPLPSNHTALDEINRIFYNFLWDGKGDKIKRDIIICEYKSGGLRMIDIKSFNKALKPTWIKKYLEYIDLAKPKSGAPGLFFLTGCRISENKRLWNCPPFGFPGNCLIMSFSSLPN